MSNHPHGKFTSEIARNLKFNGFEVYYDHGTASENVGKIVSAISEKPGRGDELGQLDIAIVEKETKKVIVLVEIEETNDRPKNFLGDIFSTLLGNHVRFKGNILPIGHFTTLIVAGVCKENHDARNEHIQEIVRNIPIVTSNAQIGNLIIKTYNDHHDLLEHLPHLLENLIKRVNSRGD